MDSQSTNLFSWCKPSLSILIKIHQNPSHRVKSFQIGSYFWPVFFCIRTRNNSVFGQFSRSVKNISEMFILGATKNVFKDFQCSEAAQIYSLKMMLLKSQQNSKENICVVSLFIKYRLPAQVCLMNFVKFLRMALLIDSLWRLALNAFKQTQPPKVFLRKDDLKICSKFAGEHPCQGVISVKLQSSGNTFS